MAVKLLMSRDYLWCNTCTLKVALRHGKLHVYPVCFFLIGVSNVAALMLLGLFMTVTFPRKFTTCHYLKQKIWNLLFLPVWL